MSERFDYQFAGGAISSAVTGTALYAANAGPGLAALGALSVGSYAYFMTGGIYDLSSNTGQLGNEEELGDLMAGESTDIKDELEE